MNNQETLSKVLKGGYSALVSSLGSLAAIMTGSVEFGDVTDGQWVAIVLAGLVGFGGTFGLAGWSGPRVNGGK